MDESEDDYAMRLARELPYFPRDVLRDWLVRYGRCAFEHHGWLDYRAFRFEQVLRSTAFILKRVRSSNEPAIRSWASAIGSDPMHRNNGIGSFMLAKGTWSTPPIVLDNRDGLTSPNGERLARFHLLEGHHRLAYLRGLAVESQSPILQSHPIWLLSYLEIRTE